MASHRPRRRPVSLIEFRMKAMEVVTVVTLLR